MLGAIYPYQAEGTACRGDAGPGLGQDRGQKSAQKANTPVVFVSLLGGLRDSLETPDMAKQPDSVCSFPRHWAPWLCEQVVLLLGTAGQSLDRHSAWTLGFLFSNRVQVAYSEEQRANVVVCGPAHTWLFHGCFTPGEQSRVEWACHGHQALGDPIFTTRLSGRRAEQRGECLDSHPCEWLSQDTPGFIRAPKPAFSATPVLI